MLGHRVIVALLLRDGFLIKTTRFKKEDYLGDPINAIRIYNEMEVDELVFLDIYATRRHQPIRFDLLRTVADECFMPMGYGGGITSLDEMREIFGIGFEKVVINSAALKNPGLITAASKEFGSQSVVASIDCKKDLFGRYRVFCNGSIVKGKTPLEWAKELERLGAGELLVNSVDRDGTWSGYDLNLISQISKAVQIPVVALGGAGKLQDISEAISHGASAAAAGSLFVYQKKDMGVLINYPSRAEIELCFAGKPS